MVVVPRGDIDVATLPAWEEAIRDVAESAEHPVIVDLSRVRFIDAAGLRLLAQARGTLRQRGLTFTLRRLSPETQKMLLLSGLLPLFSPPAVTRARPDGVTPPSPSGPAPPAPR